MKTNTVITILLLSAGLPVTAQKLNASKVPDAVKVSFSKNYPGIKAQWENENGQFEAGFKKDGKTMSALFTAAGVQTETEVDIKVTELPVAVLAYVKEHYKTISIKEAAIITKQNGTVNYEAGLAKMDVLFDSNGKFIKEVKD